jgi:very-short-patch-repair endonuclease
MIKCEICGKCYKSLGIHLKHVHKISSKTYYDKYLKKEGEGICPECRKETNFIKMCIGYSKYCSWKCASNAKNVKEKRKQTNKRKYGVEYPAQAKEVQEKMKQTNLERYGVENALQSKEIKKKMKQTNIERYGVENPFQNEEVKEKIKQASLKKYGVKCPLQSEEVKEKAKQTMLKKYGVEHQMQCPKIKEKIKQTSLKKFGTSNYNQAHLTNFDKWCDKKFVRENFLDNKKHIKIDEMIDFFNVKSFSNIYLHLKGLGIDYVKYKGTSQYEQEIYDFLRHELGILNVIQNDRQLIKPFEVDFLLPDFKFAIEFNGTYWHSEEHKLKNYHSNKTLLCKKQGVSLVHIWEDKWLENKKIFKQILKNELHKNLNNIP